MLVLTTTSYSNSGESCLPWSINDTPHNGNCHWDANVGEALLQRSHCPEAGESTKLALAFYVDPQLPDKYRTLTLSYALFEAERR